MHRLEAIACLMAVTCCSVIGKANSTDGQPQNLVENGGFEQKGKGDILLFK